MTPENMLLVVAAVFVGAVFGVLATWTVQRLTGGAR